jgi:DNA repair ATPase RecN
MAKNDEVNIVSLIVDGQKELRDSQKELRDDIKDLAEYVYTQNANIKNLTSQMDRVFTTLEAHNKILAKHSSRISSLETHQSDYYRSRKESLDRDTLRDKLKKDNFLKLSMLSTRDVLGLMGLGFLSACAIAAKLMGLF